MFLSLEIYESSYSSNRCFYKVPRMVFEFIHKIFFKKAANTVSPNKHGNLVTIFKLSTSAQLGCKVNVLKGCVPASQAEVD